MNGAGTPRTASIKESSIDDERRRREDIAPAMAGRKGLFFSRCPVFVQTAGEILDEIL